MLCYRYSYALTDIDRVQEIEVANRKVLIISVPVPQLKAFQKIQQRLVRELEKKFSGKHVLFIANVTFSATLLLN